MENDFRVNGTLVAYYYICKRKLFFFAKNIRLENYNDRVLQGKNTHESRFQRQLHREVEMDGSKFDFIQFPGEVVVHEIKHSKSLEEASIWQLKYYMYVLQQNGVSCSQGVIHFPNQMKKQRVLFGEKDREIIQHTLQEVQGILRSPRPPEYIPKSICRKCSYYEFCQV